MHSPNLPPLIEPATDVISLTYSPDSSTRIHENPPRFTWMSEPEGGPYLLEIAVDPDFPSTGTRHFSGLPHNFWTPPVVLPAGLYYWRYALDNDGAQASGWSTVRTFEIPAGLPETPLEPRETRLAKTSPSRPRLWLNQNELADLKAKAAHNPSGTWNEFWHGSVLRDAQVALPPEPLPYPNGQKQVSLWRASYFSCQEALHLVRHLAAGGVITGDSTLTAKARVHLLAIAAWDVNGPTSHAYNDEAAFRIAQALAWGYDWLADVLTPEDKAAVRTALIERTQQIVWHLWQHSRIQEHPYDSHAVRALSQAVVPCSIALHGDHEDAEGWLQDAIEYLSGLYTPWGGSDGGYSEGGSYWTGGVGHMLNAAMYIESYSGIDLTGRPFLQYTGNFPLHCYAVDTARTSFGDQSFLGQKRIQNAGLVMRKLASLTGNGQYQWYYEQTADPDAVRESVQGQYDAAFEELVFHTKYRPVTAVPPENGTILHWFRDVGWAAFHRDMADEKRHVTLVFKSSPYGSISHSHGDQNSFVLHAYGEPLAIQSGYYVAYRSTMNWNWRRQTRSKNNILIGGHGQYGGEDPRLRREASGTILDTGQTATYLYAHGDATPAYRHHVPHLRRYQRSIYFIAGSFFIIDDQVELDQPEPLTWMLHTLERPSLGAEFSFCARTPQALLEGKFLSDHPELEFTISDDFPDVKPEEYEGLPRHWQLHAHTGSAFQHRIITALVPRPANDIEDLDIPTLGSLDLNSLKDQYGLDLQ